LADRRENLVGSIVIARARPDSSVSNSRGQSIVQVLVALGISTILLMAVATMQTNQSRENRALSEKMAANDLQQQDASQFQRRIAVFKALDSTSTKPRLSIRHTL